ALGRGGDQDSQRLVARSRQREEGSRRRRGDHLASLRHPRTLPLSHQDGWRDARARARAGSATSGRRLSRRRETMPKTRVAMTVNGKAVEALVEPRTLLIHFLREDLALTGPHIGCDTTHCGACTVDLDGKSVKSCTVFAVQADGADI